jgi:hypothetical protein
MCGRTREVWQRRQRCIQEGKQSAVRLCEELPDVPPLCWCGWRCWLKTCLLHSNKSHSRSRHMCAQGLSPLFLCPTPPTPVSHPPAAALLRL